MISLPEYLEKPLLHIAQTQHITADELLTQLVQEYLEDYHDLQLAEQAAQRIDNNEDSLLDWQAVKAGLYDVAD